MSYKSNFGNVLKQLKKESNQALIKLAVVSKEKTQEYVLKETGSLEKSLQVKSSGGRILMGAFINYGYRQETEELRHAGNPTKPAKQYFISRGKAILEQLQGIRKTKLKQYKKGTKAYDKKAETIKRLGTKIRERYYQYGYRYFGHQAKPYKAKFLELAVTHVMRTRLAQEIQNRFLR